MGGVDPQGGGGGDDEGTDVQRGAGGAGHPVGLQAHQLLDGGQGVLLRQLGDAHPVAGGVDPLHVFHGAEELDGAVGGAVGLQALKDLLGVVEHHGGGVQREGGVGYDPGVVPALTLVIVEQEHVVGKNLAEAQGVGVGLGRGMLGALDLDLLHGGCLPKIAVGLAGNGRSPAGLAGTDIGMIIAVLLL